MAETAGHAPLVFDLDHSPPNMKMFIFLLVVFLEPPITPGLAAQNGAGRAGAK